MKVIWHGHSFIEFETEKGQKILVDPYITGNSKCDITVEQAHADFIVLTHAHSDHVGDTVEIAQRTGATVIAIVELAEYLAQEGLKTLEANIGGQLDFEFGSIKFVPAWHTSSLVVDGQRLTLGVPVGLIFTIDGKQIYDAGDTALFMDMQLIAQQFELDLALLPIGDCYTMGIKDAALAAEWLKAKKVLPIHYDTFPAIEQDPEAFFEKIPSEMALRLMVGEIDEI